MLWRSSNIMKKRGDYGKGTKRERESKSYQGQHTLHTRFFGKGKKSWTTLTSYIFVLSFSCDSSLLILVTMTDVKHPLTTTTTSTATASSSKRNDTLKQPSSSTTLLQSKLQRGRQLIERNSITKNGVGRYSVQGCMDTR